MFTIRRPNFFWHLGQDELPPPEEPPAMPPPTPPVSPSPPPEPTCRPVGRPFRENSSCFQIFECKAADGTITHKKEPSVCPPRPRPVFQLFAYPIYPMPLPAPNGYELTVENGRREKSSLETAAPYAVAAAGLAGLLYLVGVFG